MGARNESVVIARIGGWYRAFETNEDWVDAMVALRDVADAVSTEYDVPIFAYSPYYPFFEQYLSLASTTLLQSALAIVAIWLVSLAMVGSVRLALLVAAVVLMSTTGTFGMMRLWQVDLNAISVVNAIAGVGMSVAFTAHVTHAYVIHAWPAELDDAPAAELRRYRAARALETVGSSVLAGGLSSFLGIVPLAAAKSAIFRMYFKTFFSIILLSGLHGLVLLPVLLALVGPARLHHDVRSAHVRDGGEFQVTAAATASWSSAKSTEDVHEEDEDESTSASG